MRWWPCRTPLGRLVNEKSFVRHSPECHFQKFHVEFVEIGMSFTTNTAPLYSIGYLQFIVLVRITSIAFKWIELKAPFIECVAFAIRMRCNLSPLFTRMRYSSIIDCFVCFSTYRTRCKLMAYYNNFPLESTESPCVLSGRWQNMPSRSLSIKILVFTSDIQKKRFNAPCTPCISWVHPIFCPKSFSIRWIFGT